MDTPTTSDVRSAARKAGDHPAVEWGARLGYAASGEPPRWVLTVGRAPATGFSFDRLLSHGRVARAQVVPAPAGGARPHVRETVDAAGALLPVLELGARTAQTIRVALDSGWALPRGCYASLFVETPPPPVLALVMVMPVGALFVFCVADVVAALCPPDPAVTSWENPA